MDWEEHKSLAESSRVVIVFPWLERALSDALGPCLDVGCGSADLTAHLASRLDISIVGIDRSISDSIRTERESSRLHLVTADITKNGILETGVTFNAVFSNCCFCHIDDEQFVAVLADLFNATQEGAEFVFLVPSISWARSLYSDIEYTSAGLTALPRSGSRQHFRTPEWYISALQRAGFGQVEHEELLIPQDERLDERYLSRAGNALFRGFLLSARNRPLTRQ